MLEQTEPTANAEQLEQLEDELYNAQSKFDECQLWLCNNTQHPDFLKIAADRNHWSVKISTTEFKINQLKEGKPILGEPEGLEQEVKMITMYQSGKINF